MGRDASPRQGLPLAAADVALACMCTGVARDCMLTGRSSLQGPQAYIQSFYTTMNDLLLSGTQWDWAYWTEHNKDGFNGINLSVVDESFNVRDNYVVWPYVQVKHCKLLILDQGDKAGLSWRINFTSLDQKMVVTRSA